MNVSDFIDAHFRHFNAQAVRRAAIAYRHHLDEGGFMLLTIAGAMSTAAAGRYLAADARIWFGRKEGDGAPLRARGGPYADWDKEFRSTSTRTKPRVEGRTITYESTEINDFYRLTNRTPTAALITYYFDDAGEITGMFYRGKEAKPKEPPPPDKYDEFKTWAAKRYPGLLESEEMSIPNNPKRWRALLVEWRADVRLPVIE